MAVSGEWRRELKTHFSPATNLIQEPMDFTAFLQVVFNQLLRKPEERVEMVAVLSKSAVNVS